MEPIKKYGTVLCKRQYETKFITGEEYKVVSDNRIYFVYYMSPVSGERTVKHFNTLDFEKFFYTKLQTERIKKLIQLKICVIQDLLDHQVLQANSI